MLLVSLDELSSLPALVELFFKRAYHGLFYSFLSFFKKLDL